MSEENKYSVTIVAKSGDRTLTRVVYPEQDYQDFVTTQAVIAKALMEAGFTRAQLEKGIDIPVEVLQLFGIQPIFNGQSGVIR